MTQLPLVEDFLTHRHYLNGGGQQCWELTFPAPTRIESVNQERNKHWGSAGSQRKLWRAATHQYAQWANLPQGLHHVRIDITIQFPTGGRRDEPNYHPTVGKPVVDALAKGRTYLSKGRPIHEPGYQLVPDDTSTHVDGPHIHFGPTIGRGKGYGRITVTITNLNPPP